MCSGRHLFERDWLCNGSDVIPWTYVAPSDVTVTRSATWLPVPQNFPLKFN